jgi:hypothetical protein
MQVWKTLGKAQGSGLLYFVSANAMMDKLRDGSSVALPGPRAYGFRVVKLCACQTISFAGDDPHP